MDAQTGPQIIRIPDSCQGEREMTARNGRRKAMSETSKAKQVFESGCYYDGARGRYIVDAVVSLAESYGFKPAPCDRECAGAPHEPDEWSACEYGDEVEDDATAYMNEHFPADKAYWGRNEQSDWGLWTIDDAEFCND